MKYKIKKSKKIKWIHYNDGIESKDGKFGIFSQRLGGKKGKYTIQIIHFDNEGVEDNKIIFKENLSYDEVPKAITQAKKSLEEK